MKNSTNMAQQLAAGHSMTLIFHKAYFIFNLF